MMPRQTIGPQPAAGAEETPRARFMRERGEMTWTLVEKRLGEAPYFAGDDFTAADIIMGFPLTTMRAFAPHDLSPHPHILAYLQKIGARPAYQRAMAKGDPTMTPMLT
jgi:glutathione S-transferase